MFATLLDDCRRSLRQRQTSLLGRITLRDPLKNLGPTDPMYDRALPHYRLLLAHGRIVWAAVAQANNRLFSAGDDDLPANTLFSPSPYFDANPAHLHDIAHAVFELKGTIPADRELGHVAAIISDEMNFVSNEPLPAKLTDGHEVYMTSSVLHRVCLPQSFLADGLIPLIICPEKTFLNLPLPAQLWPASLTSKWGRLEELTAEHCPPNERCLDFTRRPPFPRDPAHIDPAELRTNHVVALTQRAADMLRSFGAQGGSTGPFVRIHLRSGGDYTLDLDERLDPRRDLVIESRGLRLIVSQAQAAELQGTVVDYRDSVFGTGFVFHR